MTDPVQRLREWLQAAREGGESMPEAMTVATISPDGWPAARMVILRGIDRGLVFYTDLESSKGVDLAANPRAATVLHWIRPYHRQVRAVGTVEPVTGDEADEYWRSRRPEARRSAAAWVQSRVVPDRVGLEARLRDYERQFPDGVELPRPERWSGFRLIPASIEFWQEAGDGVHDRMQYRRVEDRWDAERLSP